MCLGKPLNIGCFLVSFFLTDRYVLYKIGRQFACCSSKEDIHFTLVFSLSLCLSVGLFLSVCLSVSLCVSVCLSVSLCLCLSVSLRRFWSSSAEKITPPYWLLSPSSLLLLLHTDRQISNPKNALHLILSYLRWIFYVVRVRVLFFVFLVFFWFGFVFLETGFWANRVMNARVGWVSDRFRFVRSRRKRLSWKLSPGAWWMLGRKEGRVQRSTMPSAEWAVVFGRLVGNAGCRWCSFLQLSTDGRRTWARLTAKSARLICSSALLCPSPSLHVCDF